MRRLSSDKNESLRDASYKRFKKRLSPAGSLLGSQSYAQARGLCVLLPADRNGRRNAFLGIVVQIRRGILPKLDVL